jgi:hypothetical protein
MMSYIYEKRFSHDRVFGACLWKTFTRKSGYGKLESHCCVIHSFDGENDAECDQVVAYRTSLILGGDEAEKGQCIHLVAHSPPNSFPRILTIMHLVAAFYTRRHVSLDDL